MPEIAASMRFGLKTLSFPALVHNRWPTPFGFDSVPAAGNMLAVAMALFGLGSVSQDKFDLVVRRVGVIENAQGLMGPRVATQ